MNPASDPIPNLDGGYAMTVSVLRSGERDIHQALCTAAEALLGAPGESADALADDLWDGLWEGPLELDGTRPHLDSDGQPTEFRALGTLTLAPESTWTILLDCLGDTYIVALEEHADRATAEASFGSWVDEIANT